MLSKEVQILATGMGWQDYDKTKEVWALAKLIARGVIPQKVFSMDSLDSLQIVKRGEVSLEEIERIINENKIEFITAREYPKILTTKLFPLEAIKDLIGVDYFSNTVCYMIALAVLEEVDSLDLYGVNQSGLFEYMEQRRAVEFWLGIAIGRGIAVTIHAPSKLLQNKFLLPYGYEANEGQKNARKKEGGIQSALNLIGFLSGYRK